MSRRHPFWEGATELPLSLISQAVPLLTRHELTALTECLIERLDVLDGDCDIEDDDPREEDDHSGTEIDAGELDEAEHLPAPDYGIDQRYITCVPWLGSDVRINTDVLPPR